MAIIPSAGDRRALVELLRHLGAHRLRLVLAFATFAVAGALVILLGQGVRGFVDHGLHGSVADLNQAALRLLGLTLLYGLTGMGRAYLSGFIGERLSTDLRKEVFERLMREEVAAVEGGGAALVWSQVVSDAAAVQAMMGSLIGALRGAIIVVGGLVAMVLTSLSLSILVLILAPVVTLALTVLGRSLRSLSDQAQTRAARAEALALEALDGVRTVKAFVQEERISGAYGAGSEESFAFADRRNRAQGVMSGVGIWLMFAAAVLVGWAAARAVVDHKITEGLASAFLFYAVVVAASGAGLADALGQLNKGVGALARLNAAGRRPEGGTRVPSPSPPEPARRRPGASAGGSGIELEQVSFRYPMRPEVEVLSDLSAVFPEGRSVALVGRSGAGKTTLFQLLTRFYAPTKGLIRLGGADVQSWSLPDLRARIGLVPQDPTLFEGPLLENIRFGRPEATRREVMAAAEAANALEFIEDLPKGLDTEVGARGARLSGGQRQRIAIARAILKDAPILLLDEATNALDARSEHLIREAVRRFASGRTTLMIAHRLSTVREADLILVLEAGRLAASGAHDDLMAAGGLYADLAALQLQP